MERYLQQTNNSCLPGTVHIFFSFYESHKRNRKDATLCEVVTTLRNTAPHVAEYRHPLARFSFRIVYADPGNKGRFVQKDIGMVYSRDILGEPGSLNNTAPRLLLDTETEQREEKTLDNLKFIPGDFLLIAVLLPKNVTVPQELPIKGSGIAATASANGWRTTTGTVGGASGKGDSGWSRGTGPTAGGRGNVGHWRGESNAPSGRGRGGGRGGDFGRDRDLDRHESRVPPPRRHDISPPPRGDRGGRVRSRSRSRSRSPPRRRR